jgi:hypothetical protein
MLKLAVKPAHGLPDPEPIVKVEVTEFPFTVYETV